jgi:F0F1-type ATP synthase beta subunit
MKKLASIVSVAATFIPDQALTDGFTTTCHFDAKTLVFKVAFL